MDTIMLGLILAGSFRPSDPQTGQGERSSQQLSIDKTSSAELSEAINSMYAYYQNSGICYAYLVDISELDVNDDGVEAATLAKCKWFTRGWTLQELLAPAALEVLSSDWKEIGTKLSLAEQISHITGIDRKVLIDARRLSSYPVATRLSCAAKRQTTKIEDSAYCLMGLFQVNMPLIYGEGTGAFRRLQDEILNATEDYSILVWGLLMDELLEIDSSNSRIIEEFKGYHHRIQQTVLAPSFTNFSC